MAASSQINIRIDSDLKARGDDALLSAGYTVSSAIRLLWEFAALHAHEPQVIANALTFGEACASDDLDQKEQKMALLHEGSHILSDGLKALGIEMKPDIYSQMSADELRETAILESFDERI